MLDNTQKAVKGGILQLLWHQAYEVPFNVSLSLYQLGRDYLVVAAGGDAHIGAVAFDGQVNVLSPHKEGPLALELQQQLAGIIGGSVAVVAGIHYPGLQPDQIKQVVDLVTQLAGSLKRDFPSL